ncbi:MAG: Nif3-like dinuclear metal center hexameric protein [Verrucomicrobia bacterium]|nr:Nif3-like dinuclear metal center hexameric protein [Verrucomicrobiota bacterium]MCF7709365.1 Nif3-like dinuclear metal center hexameric protein [Verrucomicrobiota bacterium]
MPKVKLETVIKYCDATLEPEQFEDWSGAQNGLQMQNSGYVERIAAAVDATLSTVRKAVELKAGLMIVHHGLFWGGSSPWTGKRYEMLRLLLDNDIAVYSSHLPLDAHPEVGNNARLAAELGFRRTTPFLETKGRQVGVKCKTSVSREKLAERIAAATGEPPKLIPAGLAACRNVGIVTGGAGQDLAKAAAEGVDTFITGEGPHWTFAVAEDCGINVFYAGHYATETFGVKALTAAISRKFRVPWDFIDYPTGL